MNVEQERFVGRVSMSNGTTYTVIQPRQCDTLEMLRISIIVKYMFMTCGVDLQLQSES